MGVKTSWDSCLNRVLISIFLLFHFKSGVKWNRPSPFSMLYKNKASLTDRKPTLFRGGGDSIDRVRVNFCSTWPGLTQKSPSVSNLLAIVWVLVYESLYVYFLTSVHNLELTTEPCTVKWCWMLADNEAVTIAVNMAMIMIPTKIHTMQNIRAKNDLGARSPYLENNGEKF